MKFAAAMLLVLSSLPPVDSSAQSLSDSSAPRASSRARYEVLEEAPGERTRVFHVGFNAAPAGAGLAYGAPVFPLEAGIRIAGGLSIGPMATFSGKFDYQDAQFKLSGFGGHVTYNFGRSAIADGFFVQGFYQRYTLSATKMSTMDMGMGMSMPFPLEGSMGVNGFGGGLGYQWVWKSGLRLAAGVKVMMLSSDSSSMLLMGMNRDELNSMNQAMNAGGPSENIGVPLIEDRSQIVPLPEVSIGWAI